MKKSDHNVQMLNQQLRDEAKSLRERAKKLDDLAAQMVAEVASGNSTPHTFEFVAQQAMDFATHRSNVHLPTIARTTASLAAEAAVEWAQKQQDEAFKVALAKENAR